MKSQKEIEKKCLEIDSIRRREALIISDPFKRGQLAGAQQVLWWILEKGMEPVRAILSDAEIWLLREDLALPGLEPVEPIVAAETHDSPLCDCGMGDGSMPELHADNCAVNARA